MNSRGPRSAYVTGPTPVLAVRESSMRAPPVASVAGQFAALDMAQSIAGEPAISRKFAVAALVNFGSADLVCASWPDAAWYRATVEYLVEMYLTGATVAERFQIRS